MKKPRLRLARAAWPFVLPLSAAYAGTGPSTTVDPYLSSHLPNVIVESILTVDDGSVPKSGGGSTRLVGVPDGIGVVDGAALNPAENDVFYLLVNHEITSTQGVVRDHGAAGAFVSKWKIDKTTRAVVEGDDLVKRFFAWDETDGTYSPSATPFNRLCSADIPVAGALYNPASGKGTREILLLNGEEIAGGRAFAHVVSGPDAGNSYHLYHLGFAAFENVLVSPYAQDRTVVVMTDDTSNGEVYVYVGDKQDSGSAIERAGLLGGRLYALAVPGKPYERDDVIADEIGRSETFVLKLIGAPGDRPANGVETEARGADTATPPDPAQSFESLKMGGPEDGAWDTRAGFENVFYFVTKGVRSNGLNAVTRLWKLEFDAITDPAAGGTLTLLLDGPANRLGSLDNMAFDVVGGRAKLYIQEDLGRDPRLGKIWEYDVDGGRLDEVAAHTGERFNANGADFLTVNEESSGIVSLADVLGEGWFAASVQAHTAGGLSDPAELVQHGQLLLLNFAGRGDDVRRETLIRSGDAWDFRVDGVDPGEAWNDPGFTPPAGWNRAYDDTLAVQPARTPLGYGERDGALLTDLGRPDEPRPAASYLRREFDLDVDDALTLLDLYIKADDGAVVYLNGVEVARYNMDLAAAVDNDTFASVNEPAERDWKALPLVCDLPPLRPSGNVLAVSLHQENSASTDIRFDAELFAWYASADAGDAPAAPAGLSVGDASGTGRTLSWDAQDDAKFFRIERRRDGDVAWQVIEAEYPGELNGYIDDGLDDGVTYHYRLSAVNVHGRSACATVASGGDAIFDDGFEDRSDNE